VGNAKEGIQRSAILIRRKIEESIEKETTISYRQEELEKDVKESKERKREQKRRKKRKKMKKRKGEREV